MLSFVLASLISQQKEEPSPLSLEIVAPDTHPNLPILPVEVHIKNTSSRPVLVSLPKIVPSNYDTHLSLHLTKGDRKIATFGDGRIRTIAGQWSSPKSPYQTKDFKELRPSESILLEKSTFHTYYQVPDDGTKGLALYKVTSGKYTIIVEYNFKSYPFPYPENPDPIAQIGVPTFKDDQAKELYHSAWQGNLQQTKTITAELPLP